MNRFHFVLALLLICLPVAQPAAQGAAGKINLNTATTAELETLPGIGRVLAGRIVAHRKAHGPFRRIEDVIIVRGMSAARFRRIARLIRT
ncbi:MAG: helix-hairpin-helix domain-containing protein [Acidobacteriota bacterium]|nr:MAG: helix-hairpin-helix domain-containing protein [Acidobacteriota bacterium]